MAKSRPQQQQLLSVVAVMAMVAAVSLVNVVVAAAASEDQSVELVSALFDSQANSWRILKHQQEEGVKSSSSLLEYNVYEGAATGEMINDQGWRILTVVGNDSFSFDEQMFAAGMVEGFLSAELIEFHKANVLAALFSKNVSDAPTAVKDFLVAQHDWAKEESKKKLEEKTTTTTEASSYWEYVRGLVLQVDGVVEGMLHALFPNASAAIKEQHRGKFLGDVLYVAGAGDVPMIMSHLNVTSMPDYEQMTMEEREVEVLKQSRCSALIRVTDDFSDIFTGHSTWWNYGTMLRIYKQTQLPLPPSLSSSRTKKRGSSPSSSSSSSSAVKKMFSSTTMQTESFSSYPGVLSSQDDFYITSQAMVILQTTNTVYNADLFKLVHPKTLLSWHRVRLANVLSESGDEWQSIFRQHASGTYPNQYMVVDLKRFTPNEPLADGLLTVVEEIPGLIEAQDLTPELAKGYWPSYNVAYFENVYNLSGSKAFADKFGLDYSYEMSARAQIFRRDAPRVDDYQQFWNLMRANEYKTDPLARGDSLRAICGRGDYMKTPQPRGCIDTKTTSYTRALDHFQADIVNGPPFNDELPPFTWSEMGGVLSKQLHDGTPEVFNFNATCIGFGGVQPELCLFQS